MGLHDGLELVEAGEWTDEAHGRAFMAAGRDGRVAQSASRVLLRTSGRVRSRVVERWREEDETKAGKEAAASGTSLAEWRSGLAHLARKDVARTGGRGPTAKSEAEVACARTGFGGACARCGAAAAYAAWRGAFKLKPELKTPRPASWHLRCQWPGICPGAGRVCNRRALAGPRTIPPS